MPWGSGSTAWFETLFGFSEGGSFSATQKEFQLEGEELVCAKSTAAERMFVGPWETPSLQDLRERIAALPADAASSAGGLTFKHLATPTGVVDLILAPENAGAVFQAASQFNALEMTGPGVSPRQGIAIYANDPTQGPKCALSCPAGTVFRNYCVDVGGGKRGQGEKQIDTLADVGEVLGNSNGKYWLMKNGYALPATATAMRELGARFKKDAALADEAEKALRVGVHWDTQCRPPHTHRVCQVYASALPVAYAPNVRAADWEPFARVVLRAAYEATLAVGRLKAAKAGGRAAVFLTSLGGGAFGNRFEWIREALSDALHTHRDSPLDVVLVHYGTRVPNDWQAMPLPEAAGDDEPDAKKVRNDSTDAARATPGSAL